MSEARVNHDHRFGGIERLYGPGSLQRLQNARVSVVGIGGVGSWVAEALARSGIGAIDLVDLDDVCESNINRQIHALDPTIGQAKTSAMAERCRLVNPDCRIRERTFFYTAQTSETLFDEPLDYVMDAIDSVTHKCHLIDQCKRRKIPTIVSGGAGGRIDPSRIEIADLSQSYNDKLLQRVRKLLRTEYDFPKQEKRKFKIDCIFSPEDARYPEVCATDKEPASRRLDCSSGYGAATHITGAFGFLAAARIVEHLSRGKGEHAS